MSGVQDRVLLTRSREGGVIGALEKVLEALRSTRPVCYDNRGHLVGCLLT